MRTMAAAILAGSVALAVGTSRHCSLLNRAAGISRRPASLLRVCRQISCLSSHSLLTAGSLTSPGTAYAKHGEGAAIALGIIGGALAGAAIASSTAPAYYAAPPVYSVAPAPVYSYAPPPAAYYAPVPYYGPRYYCGGY